MIFASGLNGRENLYTFRGGSKSTRTSGFAFYIGYEVRGFFIEIIELFFFRTVLPDACMMPILELVYVLISHQFGQVMFGLAAEHLHRALWIF